MDVNTRLLILGSLPGDASLAKSEYYGHPQNKFWELVGGVVNVNLRTLPYEARLTCLLAHGIGLWDVIAEAERRGSLDVAIRNGKHNALMDLIGSLPALKTVAFNGAATAKIGRRQLASVTDQLVLFDLPSSSPANTAQFEQKAQAWGNLTVCR